jgi:hypothetical protein
MELFMLQAEILMLHFFELRFTFYLYRQTPSAAPQEEPQLKR